VGGFGGREDVFHYLCGVSFAGVSAEVCGVLEDRFSAGALAEEAGDISGGSEGGRGIGETASDGAREIRGGAAMAELSGSRERGSGEGISEVCGGCGEGG